MIFCEAEQGSSEWLIDRLCRITGSNAHKLSTPAKMKTYMDELAVESVTQEPTFIKPTKDMERGTYLEPFARDAFVQHMLPKTDFSFEVKEVGFIQSELNSRWGCSVDGMTNDGGIIEVKCRNDKNHLADFISIKKEAMYQMQWNMFISETSHCYFVGFSDRFESMPLARLNVQKIERDEELIGKLKDWAETATNMLELKLIELKQCIELFGAGK